ncbi:thiosulfate oxidation carrier complex protein SoxZ [Thermithiobacillus plumbiphilus]|uniref:Thiosulfate oxidation carrier complex protein SoxZ n=1 Tax=Thermithiobacillus plumbiphilus TaxID=1729899 RepID=A0ABU9DA71_9PROT
MAEQMGNPKIRVPESAKKGEAIQVRALILHPMETGQRKDTKTGEKIPEHFIQQVSAEYNGKKVMEADWGVGVSKNPFLSFYIKPEESGTLKLTFTDNKGGSWSEEAKVQVS